MDRRFYGRFVDDQITSIDRQLWLLNAVEHPNVAEVVKSLQTKRKMLVSELNWMDSHDPEDFVDRLVTVMPKIIAVRPPLPDGF